MQYVLMNICKIQKIVQNTDTGIEKKCMDTKWGMWGGINRETGIDIYTLLGKDYTVNENLQYSTGKKK